MLVECEDIGKRFGDVVALDGVSVGLRAGEVHVLLGENGAGKSTLAGLLAGLLVPDTGTIRIDGAAVQLLSPRRAQALGIGAVRQHSVLVPSLTVAENLVLGGRWFRAPRRAQAAARFRDIAAGLGIAVDPSRRVASLSLGERQQAEIVRALWHGSRVLVLDEPTAMLTPAGTRDLLALMRKLAANNTAIVFITHKLDEALDAGDRVTVLRRGRRAGTIPPDALRGERAALRAEMSRLIFGQAPSAPSPAAPRAPGAALLRVQAVSLRAARLDAIGFDVRAGEILGIAGVDGNGQQALAEILAGQIAPDAGNIWFDGAEVTHLGVAARYRRGLRYVTDDRLHEGTVGGFSIATNLLLKRIGQAPFWTRGVERRAAIAAHGTQMMRRFDIRAPGPATPVRTLSGGNIQKLLLARELAGAPRLVVFGKPTNGLDARNAAATHRRIRDLAAGGGCAVVISPDLEELLALSDRIGVLLRGRLAGVVANGAEARQRVAALMTGAAS